MKRIIFYLAKISGITDSIQKQTLEQVGSVLILNSYWFNAETREVLKMHGEAFSDGGIPDAGHIRKKVLDV